jgi:hypothetical protein
VWGLLFSLQPEDQRDDRVHQDANEELKQEGHAITPSYPTAAATRICVSRVSVRPPTVAMVMATS